MAERREKSDKAVLIPIPDWGHADLQVQRIGALQSQIEKLEIAAGELIDKVKGDLQKQVKPLQEKINLHVASIEAFAEANKGEFDKVKVRSRKGQFGTVGWRKSTSIVTKKNTLELIKEKLAGNERKMCIIIKEAISKEALAKLTDEELASVGARREEKDVFYVEPDITESVQY